MSMHEVHVSVVSPEEASYGVAEFWSGGRLIGFTHLDDGDLMLRIEPRHDGGMEQIREGRVLGGARDGHGDGPACWGLLAGRMPRSMAACL